MSKSQNWPLSHYRHIDSSFLLPKTLVFCCQRSTPNSNDVFPNAARNMCTVSKSAIFEHLAISQKWQWKSPNISSFADRLLAVAMFLPTLTLWHPFLLMFYPSLSMFFRKLIYLSCFTLDAIFSNVSVVLHDHALSCHTDFHLWTLHQPPSIAISLKM